MRMSVLSYFALGIATFMVLFTYAVNPDPDFLRMALPMLLILAAVPLTLNWMNRRQADSIDMRNYKFYKIKDLSRLENGAPVRFRGTVEKASLKWLNRPQFHIDDGSGRIGIFMFAAPRDNIKPGDSVEAAGSLRSFGLSKERKVWGVRMEKLKH